MRFTNVLLYMYYRTSQRKNDSERRIMDHAAQDGTTVLLPKRRRWASLAVLTASLLVITMDMTILNVALPQMTAELKPTSEQVLWMVDAYSLALAGLLVTMSGLGDRLGRRRLLIIGYVLFGAGSGFALIANSAEFVIALRVVLGVGGAMIMPTTLSMIRSVFPHPKERSTAIAVWAAVSALGAAIGPIVGGFLLEHFSWHAAFLVNVPLMIVAVFGALAILPEVRVSNPGRWDYVGAALSIGGMALLPFAIKRFAQEMTLADPLALGALAASIAFIALFVRHCRRRPDPLLDMGLFKRRSFTGGIIAALGSLFALAAMMLLLAQWMQLVHNYSPIETGVRMLPFALSGLLASLVAPMVARRIGARATIAAGICVASLGIFFIWFNGAHLTFNHIVVSMLCIGVGEGALTVGSAMIMSGTPPEKAGNAAAIEGVSYDLGNVLGVAVVGSIASLLYKASFDIGMLATLDPARADAAKESLGAALDIAHQMSLPDVASHAIAAFNASLSGASLVGGVIMFVVAVAAFFTIPKGTDIDTQSH